MSEHCSPSQGLWKYGWAKSADTIIPLTLTLHARLAAALKFCRKSIALYETKDALSLLNDLQEPTASTSSSAGTRTSESTTPRQRTTEPGTPKDDSERVAVVRRIRACKATQYYEIMGLEKTCLDQDIKKAYRKARRGLLFYEIFTSYQPTLVGDINSSRQVGRRGCCRSVQKYGFSIYSLTGTNECSQWWARHGKFLVTLHPEHNTMLLQSMILRRGSPQQRVAININSEEAKSLRKSYSICSSVGADSTAEAALAVHQVCVSIKNFCLRSLMNRKVFTASFGPNGFQRARTRHHPQAQRQQEAQTTSPLLQVLPIIILFIISFLGSLPSLSSMFTTPDPGYTFSPTRAYSTERITSSYKVPYYVNKQEFESHSIYESIPLSARDSKQAGTTSHKLRSFENGIERVYVGSLRNGCNREAEDKERRMEQHRGFFGIGGDWAKVEEIRVEAMPSCQRLRDMGLLSY